MSTIPDILNPEGAPEDSFPDDPLLGQIPGLSDIGGFGNIGGLSVPGTASDPLAIFGKGGGKGESAQLSPELLEAMGIFQNIGRQQLALGDPFLESGTADAATLLAGGIPDSLRPAVLTSLEQGRSNASQALTENREAATLAGVTGSALQENLTGARAGAESQVASIPQNFTLPALQEGASQVFGAPQAGLDSLVGAISAGSGGVIPGRQPGGTAGGLQGAAGGALTGFQVGGPYGALAGGILGGYLGSK